MYLRLNILTLPFIKAFKVLFICFWEASFMATKKSYLTEVKVPLGDRLDLHVGPEGAHFVPAVQAWGIPPHLGLEAIK